MKNINKVFFVLILPLLLSACVSLDVANFDTSSNMVLEEDENRLWQRSKEEQERISSGNFLYDCPVLTQYVNSILNKVVPQNVKDSKLLFEARIIKDPRLNAFCFPDGVIYIHIGILARMDNEAQLATLLGHEITHAIRRHLLRQFRSLKNKTAFMNTFYVTSAGLGGSYGELLGSLGQLGTIAAFYGYSREHEREADKDGFERMLSAGYDVEEAPKLFEHLKENFDKEKMPQPFFFSSHPKLNERIKSFNELIKNLNINKVVNQLKIKNEEEFIKMTKDLLLDNADMDISLGRLETARITVGKFISHFPDSAKGYYYMGKIYEHKFQQPENKKLKEKITKEEIKQKAKEFHNKAITLDPNFTLSYRNLGIIYFKEGNKKEAKKYLVNYLALSSNEKDKYIENYVKECGNE